MRTAAHLLILFGRRRRDGTLGRASAASLLGHGVLAMVMLPALACAGTAAEIRRLLEQHDAGAPLEVAGSHLTNGGEISRFYRARRHEPVWVEDGKLRIADLIEAIRSAEGHGLPAWRYHLDGLESPGSEVDAAERELLATDAFISQVRHRSVGVVAPRDLDPLWFVPAGEVDTVQLLSDAAGDGELLPRLDALWPDHREYGHLVRERARLAAASAEERPPISAGPPLEAGQRGERVRALRRRLLGEDAGDDDRFDDALATAVREFQQSAGLEADGVVGPATLTMLNETRATRIAHIDANLERWRWLPETLPDTLLRVNIAAFTLRAIVEGREELRMNVVVGRPYRKTPVFTETMKYFVMNPFWNVPSRLARQDKLPKLRADSAAMAAEGYEARATGSESFVAVDRLDWTAVTDQPFEYQLRQRPGPMNALGRIKFMLPNPYAIYLHDTPERDLFRRTERGFSSGCIRLEDPIGLARWLLAHDGQADIADDVARGIDDGETRTVYLQTPLPTLITYFTVFEDSDGRIMRRRDIYQRDDAVVQALRSTAS